MIITLTTVHQWQIQRETTASCVFVFTVLAPPDLDAAWRSQLN
jgi:hypothetical protein